MFLINKKSIEYQIKEAANREVQDELKEYLEMDAELTGYENETEFIVYRMQTVLKEFYRRYEIKVGSRYLGINLLIPRYTAVEAGQELSNFLFEQGITFNLNFNYEESYFKIEYPYLESHEDCKETLENIFDMLIKRTFQ